MEITAMGFLVCSLPQPTDTDGAVRKDGAPRLSTAAIEGRKEPDLQTSNRDAQNWWHSPMKDPILIVGPQGLAAQRGSCIRNHLTSVGLIDTLTAPFDTCLLSLQRHQLRIQDMVETLLRFSGGWHAEEAKMMPATSLICPMLCVASPTPAVHLAGILPDQLPRNSK